jgi:Na+-transporting methylmalonyl-CoA/oxaloacetate decarboxylase gamma subunit
MSELWSQTWLIVILGMICVFLFLAFLSWGLRMLGAYARNHPDEDTENVK